MEYFDLISNICLCALTICIFFFIRFIRVWQIDIRAVSSRLDSIEKELHHHRTSENAIKEEPEEEKISSVSPPLFMEDKPTGIDLIRYYIQLYHPTLLEEISNFSPEKLTQTDELLCMMIKLGYNNKEVASILSITTNSVLTARYRLKRKLQLPEGRQLDSWISHMGNPLMKKSKVEVYHE